MFEMFHIPDDDSYRISYYTGDGASATLRSWNKPAGISLVQIITIGAGGGGGGGTGYVAGTFKYAGVGGGSGALTTVTYQASLIPDVLYISTGLGGTGGTGNGANVNGGNGSNGTATTVYWTTRGSTSNFILATANGGTGGAGGRTTGVGNASGGTAVATTAAPVGQIGLRTLQAGLSAPFNTNITSNFRISGGVSGGTISSLGGITSFSLLYPPGDYVLQPINTSGGGEAGSGGINNIKQLISTGGVPGGNSITLTGANSGNGGFGSGGGGGCNGNPLGGNGGRGGHGLVVIICK